MGSMNSQFCALACMKPLFRAQLWAGRCEESQEKRKVLPFDPSY